MMPELKPPYGLEDKLVAHGDDTSAIIETENGQWIVAVVDEVPVPNDIDPNDPAPWSCIDMATFLANAANAHIAPATRPDGGDSLREALENFVRVCDSAPPIDFVRHIGEACAQAKAALAPAKEHQEEAA